MSLWLDRTLMIFWFLNGLHRRPQSSVNEPEVETLITVKAFCGVPQRKSSWAHVEAWPASYP